MGPKSETFSIVVTTHNSAAIISRCIESILPFLESGAVSEMIVVDSNSTDATCEIIRRYPVTLLQESGTEAYRDSAIRVYHSTYRSLDQGWRSATGDIVMFLDSDAYLGPDMFPTAADFFADPGLGMVGGWQRVIGDSPFARTMAQFWRFHKERIRAVQERPTIWGWLYLSIAWFGNKQPPIGGPCYMVRKTCLEEINGHDIFGDAGIAPRLWERGWRTFWWVDAPVFHPTKESIWALAKQRYSWGYRGQIATASAGDTNFQLNKRGQYLSVPAAIVWDALLGVWLSVKLLNPRHLVVHPVATMAHVIGAIKGRIAKMRGAR